MSLAGLLKAELGEKHSPEQSWALVFLCGLDHRDVRSSVLSTGLQTEPGGVDRVCHPGRYSHMKETNCTALQSPHSRTQLQQMYLETLPGSQVGMLELQLCG
jgi:hypothetical protein